MKSFKQIITEKNSSNFLNEDQYDHRAYLKWKRKNVTIRGVSGSSPSSHNGVLGSLGKGLYTAFLSNRSMARQYGKVYFVLGAIPKKPKVFDSLNRWEIFFQNMMPWIDGFPSRREFEKTTTIEKEMIKKGYDGIVIKGREMVNFKPDMSKVRYFSTEEELKNYYINKVAL